jgi:hypothetical protein
MSAWGVLRNMRLIRRNVRRPSGAAFTDAYLGRLYKDTGFRQAPEESVDLPP